MNLYHLGRRFVVHLLPVRGLVAWALLLTLVTPILGVATLWLVRSLTDLVFIGNRQNLLPAFLAGYATLAAIRFACSTAYSRTDAAITGRIALDVRTSLYRHVLSVSPGSLKRLSVGEILSHLSGDSERIEQLIYSAPVSMISNLVNGVVFTAFLFTISWKLTLCALVIAPIMALVSVRNSTRLRRMSRIARKRRTGWFSLAEERLGATPLIQAFCAEDRETDRFHASSARSFRAELRNVVIRNRMSAVREVLAVAGATLVIGLGAREVHDHVLTVGSLIAFLGSVGSLYSPARSMASSWSRIHRSAAAAERISAILAIESLVADKAGAIELTAGASAISFENVTFGYAGSEPVLNGVSFEARPGRTIAIVGASGAGKSTLARLAIRLHDPESGRILIDGHDLRDVTVKSLRRTVSLVLQDAFILRGSIADNIRFGAPDETMAAVREVAGAAKASGFVDRLPAGFASPVGPRGAELSGGQRQRLALARALLRRSPILILDEAAASLDSETEELIQEAVERLSEKKTLILISHRLSSVMRADEVIVLDRGRIVEAGAPAQLLASGVRFRELFGGQIMGERLAA